MQSDKPLHIIIDGADKTGKSTVCQKLSEVLKLPVIKMSNMPRYYKKGLEEEASEVFNRAIVQFKHTSFIMDRGFPSSLVYTRYFMRKANLHYIGDIAKELDARIFILDVTPRKVDNILSYVQQEELRFLYQKFADKYKWTLVPCTDQTPDQICSTIVKEINRLEMSNENILLKQAS